MAKAEYKPLSFTTTLRNPERIPAFLKCLLPFEGMALSKAVIHNVVKNILREKLYKPMGISTSHILNEIWQDDEAQYSELQLEEIVRDNPQNHKEAGFDKGWDSRFDTWYKITKELGFVNYGLNQSIIITQTGHMLIDAYSETPCNGKKIQKVYLNAFMKYQANNPFRKTLNENAPLPLLLNVIKKLREDYKENSPGVSCRELPILICWPNNNADAVCRYIKKIRQAKKFAYSDEYIYKKCLGLLKSSNRKRWKFDRICHEAVDEYVRKMRMTGLLSLRGNGRFIDINKFEEDAANYVIENYSTYEKFATADAYITYMGSIDSIILNTREADASETATVKQKTLKEYAAKIAKETIFNELKIVCSKNQASRDPIFSIMPAPVRLEFLTSIALVQNFSTLAVKPNYPVDDEGMPTSTAAGGYADIECFDADCDSYCEVTLMRGRAEQVNNEVIPISRHLKAAIKERREESFALLIAPVIHEDTAEACDWQKQKYAIDIVPYNIVQFIEKITEAPRISSLKV